jgi:anti-sigma regulatory factor (Ser/Thr protein kinase)/anti-anti-sigma regulatory factor
MWQINPGTGLEIQLPASFNDQTMYEFIAQAVDGQCNAQSNTIVFGFTKLAFISPVGIVVLSNLIEYFVKIGVKTYFSCHQFITEPISYLDDSGFFKRYIGSCVKVSASVRPTTFPLSLVQNVNALPFVQGRVIPWAADHLGTTETSLDTVRVCIEEIFHNIQDHSGVQMGCIFAQFFPKTSRLEIAISDFGFGIPHRIQTLKPELSDTDSLRLAIQEGFTTKTNVHNRGVGLTTLMRYVTIRNGGTVLIASGKAQLSAVLDQNETKITVRTKHVSYPGTLVKVILRTDRLAQLAADIQPEDFSWK